MPDSKEVQALRKAVDAHSRILTVVRVSPEREDDNNEEAAISEAAK